MLCVAGEASGDRLLAPVVAALRARTGAHCIGTGGDEAAASGLELLAHVREFTAAGLLAALPAVPAVWQVWRRLVAWLPRVDAVVLVDAPELNSRLLRRAVALGRPTAWLAPPQAWAWRPGRAEALRAAALVGCLFPFEQAFYAARGVPAVWLGHPLADVPAPAPATGRGLALLPGSRAAAVRRLLPPMLAAAARLQAAGTIDAVHLGCASTLPPGLVQGLAGRCDLRVRLHPEAANALSAARVAIAGAGTVTLQAALAGRPVLTLARTDPASAFIARRLVRVSHLALPNLLLGRRAFPELWQGDVNPRAIAAHCAALLEACSGDAPVVPGPQNLDSLAIWGPGADGGLVGTSTALAAVRAACGTFAAPFGSRVAALVAARLGLD